MSPGNGRGRPDGSGLKTPAKKSCTEDTPPHEMSAWLRARVADRLARIRALGIDPNAAEPIVIAPLGRAATPGTPEDFSCDRCATIVDDGRPFVLVDLMAARGVRLFGGLCQPCAVAEGWQVAS